MSAFWDTFDLVGNGGTLTPQSKVSGMTGAYRPTLSGHQDGAETDIH